MKKSEKIISFEEWMQTIEFEEGYRKRRQEKDSYLKNPKYIHPFYGTPLMEPYKCVPKSAEANCNERPVNLWNPSQKEPPSE